MISEIWNDITGNMRPWFKWTGGVVLFLLTFFAYPFLIALILWCIPIIIFFALMDFIWEKIKPLFFKQGE